MDGFLSQSDVFADWAHEDGRTSGAIPSSSSSSSQTPQPQRPTDPRRPWTSSSSSSFAFSAPSLQPSLSPLPAPPPPFPPLPPWRTNPPLPPPLPPLPPPTIPYEQWIRQPASDSSHDGGKGKANRGQPHPTRVPQHPGDPAAPSFWQAPPASDYAWIDQLALDGWREEEPARSAVNGGRERRGRSGGVYQPYYAAFYKAKGKGKDVLNKFLQKHGRPPSRGGKSFHARKDEETS
jgi:hypothetical protein